MKTTLQHIFVGIVHGLIWLIPIAVASHPTWGTTTISGILSSLAAYLQTKFPFAS